jgi:hypothetical protein
MRENAADDALGGSYVVADVIVATLMSRYLPYFGISGSQSFYP